MKWPYLLIVLSTSLLAAEKDSGFMPLFPEDGVPKGWSVRAWDDVKNPAKESVWRVEHGVLNGSEPRGTWLVSDKEYGDFILEFEFKLGERGNSGCGIRFPDHGDPAFDGMEIQMADFRYNEQAKDSELTGGIYRAIAPKKQVYKPTQWNKYHIELKGDHLKVILNDELIQDLNLSEHSEEVKRHNGALRRPSKIVRAKDTSDFRNSAATATFRYAMPASRCSISKRSRSGARARASYRRFHSGLRMAPSLRPCSVRSSYVFSRRLNSSTA